jgi:type IV secretory pathway VirB4 component
MFAMSFDKGKKMFSKEKLMDKIENKYEDLRKSRREMLVTINS